MLILLRYPMQNTRPGCEGFDVGVRGLTAVSIQIPLVHLHDGDAKPGGFDGVAVAPARQPITVFQGRIEDGRYGRPLSKVMLRVMFGGQTGAKRL